jgi:N-acetylmuramate 1-kinase
VALLNDSYQIISHDFVLARLREFCAHRQIGEQLPEVCREFDMVTVQRKLKDAGRFVFIEHKKGDATYLKFVEPTIAKARMALRRLVDSAEMRALESWLCTAVGGP